MSRSPNTVRREPHMGKIDRQGIEAVRTLEQAGYSFIAGRVDRADRALLPQEPPRWSPMPTLCTPFWCSAPRGCPARRIGRGGRARADHRHARALRGQEVAGRQGSPKGRASGGAVMRRTAGVWYLAIFFASVGLLSIIAWDALRGRSHDHVLALSPSPMAAEPGNSGCRGHKHLIQDNRPSSRVRRLRPT